MMAVRRRGMIIVTDRYPPLDFPGAYDGTGLSASAPGSTFVRWLARRERKLYEWMTSYRPELVIRLNVDLDTACARKPDHRRSLMRDKVAATSRSHSTVRLSPKSTRHCRRPTYSQLQKLQ